MGAYAAVFLRRGVRNWCGPWSCPSPAAALAAGTGGRRALVCRLYEQGLGSLPSGVFASKRKWD